MKKENISNFYVPDKEIKKSTKQDIKEGINEHYDIEPYEKKKPIKHDLDREQDYNHEDGDKNIPPGIFDAEYFYRNNEPQDIDDIYECYAKAMMRRNREPLGRDSFEAHFFEGGSYDTPYMYGDQEKGYLLGYVRYGVFIPSHFAPRSIRKGYEMMKELGASFETPVVMSVTDDLAETLKKMPEWNIVDTSFLTRFRGKETEKMIAYNSHPNTKQLMFGLLYDYLQEQEEERKYYNEDESDDE